MWFIRLLELLEQDFITRDCFNLICVHDLLQLCLAKRVSDSVLLFLPRSDLRRRRFLPVNLFTLILYRQWSLRILAHSAIQLFQ